MSDEYIKKGKAFKFGDNISTDHIAPGRLFHLRNDLAEFSKHVLEDADPEFAKKVQKGDFVVAGNNFGLGSSREHAVWGLMQYGIRVVIATGFGEIFYSNCFNNGLLAAKVTSDDAQEIFEYLSDNHAVKLTVDVEKAQIRSEDDSKVWSFFIAQRHQTMLLEGLDMLEATMKDIDLIKRFKTEHEKAFPWMSNLAGQYTRNR